MILLFFKTIEVEGVYVHEIKDNGDLYVLYNDQATKVVFPEDVESSLVDVNLENSIIYLRDFHEDNGIIYSEDIEVDGNSSKNISN
ncbi:hypothetical protein ACFFIX_19775 [Metabacillus herbersteinensis]|uniref:Uncharacterized protein n=1 Tax=Metabacillus herbersteinensis TaxID=283816 RepID=A0ABV6GIW3_9BACI